MFGLDQGQPALAAAACVAVALQAAAGMIWGGDSQAYPQPFGNTSISAFGREWPITAYDLVVTNPRKAFRVQ